MFLLRKIVFYLFAASYCAACPLLILYALGYVLEPGTQPGIAKSGLIYLSTIPPRASITLQGRRVRKITPAILSGLLPGRYVLRISLKNRRPWSRTVAVEPEKAVPLDKILLLPKKLKKEELLEGPFKDLLPVPGTRFLLLAKGPKLKDQVVYDWSAQTGRSLVLPDSSWAEAQVNSLYLFNESPFVLFQLRLSDRERWIRIDLGGSQAKILELSALLPVRPRWVEWDPRRPNQLFVVGEDDLSRVDLETMEVFPRVAEGLRGFGLYDGQGVILTEGGRFLRIDAEGDAREILSEDPEGMVPLLNARGNYRVRGLTNGLFLLWGEWGDLWVNRPVPHLIETAVAGFELDPAKERLLLWRRDRLGVLGSSEIHWAVTDGREIRQAFWVYEGSHALFRDQDRISLVELDTPGKPIPAPLVYVRSGSSVSYLEETGTVYYLDRLTGELMSLEVIPRSSP